MVMCIIPIGIGIGIGIGLVEATQLLGEFAGVAGDGCTFLLFFSHWLARLSAVCLSCVSCVCVSCVCVLSCVL